MRASALLVALALASAACTSSPPEGDGTAEVELVYFGDPVEARGYEAMVTSFEAQDPGVDVQTSPVASKADLLARLTTRFAAGDPPDVFLLNYREYAQFAAEGVLADVQPLLDASDLDEGDFFPAPLDAFRFDGTDLTCMPQNVSSLVVYANVDLLRERGVELPTAGWTWDDLVAAASRVTDPAADVYGLGTVASLPRLAPFVWSNGGSVVDDETDPHRLTLDEPAAREALDFFLDLALVHQVTPPVAAEESLDAFSRFLAGGVGLYLDSRRAVPAILDGADFAWTALPLPVAPGGEPATILHADAYCIAADGDVDAAWELVRYAMSADGQTIVAETGRIVPSRRDVAGTATFRDSAPPGVAETFLDNTTIVRATPHVAAWSQLEKVADDVLTEMFYGRVGREDGLRRLSEESTRLLARP
ncbi:hypothetical protein CCE01nite_14830 [Cellulomonas cellasea]|uniref:Sugar ABC transporter substrate-binding protein n=1 Tax=Cellulomonas cellasea TaxID=43670 RepID=A0A4Y3KVQ6_9CELL|nr:hypothetical protein CCE01nite_14830 [Cellulomonas cellasea]